MENMCLMALDLLLNQDLMILHTFLMALERSFTLCFVSFTLYSLMLTCVPYACFAFVSCCIYILVGKPPLLVSMCNPLVYLVMLAS
jgi:hypothetical protein